MLRQMLDEEVINFDYIFILNLQIEAYDIIINEKIIIGDQKHRYHDLVIIKIDEGEIIDKFPETNKNNIVEFTFCLKNTFTSPQSINHEKGTTINISELSISNKRASLKSQMDLKRNLARFIRYLDPIFNEMCRDIILQARDHERWGCTQKDDFNTIFRINDVSDIFKVNTTAYDLHKIFSEQFRILGRIFFLTRGYLINPKIFDPDQKILCEPTGKTSLLNLI